MLVSLCGWRWVAGSRFDDGVAVLCGAGFDNGVAVLCGAGLRFLGSVMEWLCSVVLGCGWLLRMA